MPKYRKKPLIIEAEQFLPEQDRWPKGVRNSLGMICGCGEEGAPHVHTAHNDQIVVVVSGDWIVPESDGVHYYPIKNEVFEKTYDQVEDE